MNTIHDKGKNGDPLQNDLEQIGRAYGHLEQTEPPDLVDQAILNSAHRAVEEKPHWMRFSWLHGLTTAAVFGLAISLVLNQPEDTPLIKESTGINGDLGLPQEEQAVNRVNKATSEKMEVSGSGFDELRLETEDQAESAAADTEVVKRVSEIRAKAPAQKARQATSGPGDISLDDPKDADHTDMALSEQSLSDEADAIPGSPAGQGEKAQPAPVMATEPLTSVSNYTSEKIARIEQQIQAILRLKEAGDETWVMELETFRRNYPDYPLPEELEPEEH